MVKYYSFLFNSNISPVILIPEYFCINCNRPYKAMFIQNRIITIRLQFDIHTFFVVFNISKK